MRAFPEAYADQLAARYGDAIAGQITDPAAVQFADLPHQPGQTIPFVEVGPVGYEPKGNKVLYVPGFGEDIINKASFAAELAINGKHVIVPGQNRKGVLKDETGRRNATYTQALNYLAVLQAAALGETVDFVPHSYGSLELDEMVRLAPHLFADSNVVMLAPAGSICDQGLFDMFGQWLGFMKSEADGDRPMEFPDKKGYTGRASARVLAANLLRTGLEVRDLWKRNVDYARVARIVESLVVLSYAKDRMFPEEALSMMLAAAVGGGHTTWATPTSRDKALSDEMNYGIAGAVHDDEQYNPSRVAGAALQFLS